MQVSTKAMSNENREQIQAMTAEVRNLVNELFDKYYKPRIEMHIENRIYSMLESLVEQKVNEHFAELERKSLAISGRQP